MSTCVRLIDIRLCAVALLAFMAVLGQVAHAVAQPAFPERYNTILEVEESFGDRARSILYFHACDHGSNNAYDAFLKELDNDDFKNQGENLTSLIIAKIGLNYMLWQGRCGEEERQKWESNLGASLSDGLKKYKVHGQLGSSDLPCFSDPEAIIRFQSIFVEGDYDVVVRELIRVLFLSTADYDERITFPPQHFYTGRPVFNLTNCQGSETCLDIINYIVTNLLITKGGLSRHSYDITDCGNQDRNTDSPEDYADRLDWIDRVVDDLVVGGLEWLLDHLWAILVFLAPAASVLGGLAAVTNVPLLGAAGSLLVLAGSPILEEIPFFRFPETENHLLMIESSRYLTNQFMLDHYLQQHPNRAQVVAEQQEVEDWLLDKMRSIVRYDFQEYNSRAYQRYSLNSILNLHDFAKNQKIKEAAKAVLEMADAKFAVGSNRGRRFAPFQRLAEWDC